jgi:hypothetical protein
VRAPARSGAIGTGRTYAAAVPVPLYPNPALLPRLRLVVTGNTVEKTFRAGEKVRMRSSARRGAAHAARRSR